MLRNYLFFLIGFFFSIELLCAQNATKLPFLESAIQTFQGNAPYSEKLAMAQKLAKSKEYYPEILERLSHPAPLVRLWFLRTLAEFDQELWQEFPLKNTASNEPAVLIKTEPSAVLYSFPEFSSIRPVKFSFTTSLSAIGGTLRIGAEEFIFGFNSSAYHFYRKGETPNSVSWTPCFLEERVVEGNLRDKYVNQLNQQEFPVEIWTALNQRLLKDEISFSEQNKLTLEKVRENKEWNLLDTPNLRKYIVLMETESSRPFLNVYPNEKVHLQVVCYEDFLCLYLFYAKDIYPQQLQRKQKTIMRCYEELFIPYVSSKSAPIKITLTNSIWNENIQAFEDPFLYKITPLILDENPEIRYQALDLLVRASKEGGRDYIRRLLECKIPSILNFLKREGLLDSITQLYRNKILDAFNQERRAGAGHYEGQFRDVTLMGRQVIGECLLELVSRHNDDLENLMIRMLACQALQELQYSPNWFRNKMEILRQSIDNLMTPEAIPEQWQEDEIKRRLWIEALRELGSVVASALYMLGEDSHFKREETQLLSYIRSGYDPFGRSLLYVEMDLAYLYLRFRMYERALDRYFMIIKNKSYNKNQLSIVYYNMACSYAMKRMKKEALDAFRISVEDCEYSNLEWLLKDRDLDYIRNEPEFIRLVKKLEDFNNR
ncbi:MAG: hypothetical protein AABZ60_07845 [Planctomycetota bacterium]